MSKIPFDKIVNFGQTTLLENRLFTVSWILARFCNYNCSYCWPYARSSVDDHFNIAVYLNALNSIKDQARKNGLDKFHFSFSGGEPTAYKHFGELIEFYCNDTQSPYQSIHMTTNLSPGSKWWARWLETTKTLQRRSITASYHSEFAKEQEFGDKCLQLINDGVFVTNNQVMVPSMYDELYDRCSRFADRGINVTLKPQSDSTASFVVSGYTPEQIKIMQEGFPQKWGGEEISQIYNAYKSRFGM